MQILIWFIYLSSESQNKLFDGIDHMKTVFANEVLVIRIWLKARDRFLASIESGLVKLTYRRPALWDMSILTEYSDLEEYSGSLTWDMSILVHLALDMSILIEMGVFWFGRVFWIFDLRYMSILAHLAEIWVFGGCWPWQIRQSLIWLLPLNNSAAIKPNWWGWLWCFGLLTSVTRLSRHRDNRTI